MLVLERWRTRRGGCAHLRGVVGLACPPMRTTSPSRGLKAQRCDAASLDDAVHAGIPAPAGRVGYINAHGTGTPTNDAVEAAAIHQSLGEFAPHIP